MHGRLRCVTPISRKGRGSKSGVLPNRQFATNTDTDPDSMLCTSRYFTSHASRTLLPQGGPQKSAFIVPQHSRCGDGLPPGTEWLRNQRASEALTRSEARRNVANHRWRKGSNTGLAPWGGVRYGSKVLGVRARCSGK